MWGVSSAALGRATTRPSRVIASVGLFNGERQACIQVLQKLREHHCAHAGMPMDQVPIIGLWGDIGRVPIPSRASGSGAFFSSAQPAPHSKPVRHVRCLFVRVGAASFADFLLRRGVQIVPHGDDTADTNGVRLVTCRKRVAQAHERGTLA